ncbi:MAG: hypothetical protein H9847_03770 [Candidatus Anaerobiospirillum pullicola]|uniref:Uncharacterized protein n=1 Tax=Candidatus Anaerobiospirillum pullicola TaxID=2838451 RepID=A0A948WZB6_9GAMM|nr:hypothetical protein [Candidatus Anaerobiospirillum pullicola]
MQSPLLEVLSLKLAGKRPRPLPSATAATATTELSSLDPPSAFVVLFSFFFCQGHGNARYPNSASLTF